MYSRQAGRDEFVLSEALSFWTARSSDLMIVIKLMINEVSNLSCTVGTLHLLLFSSILFSDKMVQARDSEIVSTRK